MSPHVSWPYKAELRLRYRDLNEDLVLGRPNFNANPARLGDLLPSLLEDLRGYSEGLPGLPTALWIPLWEGEPEPGPLLTLGRWNPDPKSSGRLRLYVARCPPAWPQNAVDGRVGIHRARVAASWRLRGLAAQPGGGGQIRALGWLRH